MKKIPDIFADERGQATLEWTLLIAMFGIPMLIAVRLLLYALTEHYRMITCLETLPFP